MKGEDTCALYCHFQQQFLQGVGVGRKLSLIIGTKQSQEGLHLHRTDGMAD